MNRFSRPPFVALLLLLISVSCSTPQDVIGDEIEDRTADNGIDTATECRAYLDARLEYGAAVESLQGQPLDNAEPPLREPAQKMMQQANILSKSDDAAVAGEAQGVIDAFESSDPQAFGTHLAGLTTYCEAVSAP